MRNYIRGALSLITISILSLVAGGASAADEPAHGGTLVIGTTQAPNTLNPAIQSGYPTLVPATQLFASPLRYDADWNPHPYLAKSWELAPDGKSLTLHLVGNAVFHDGTPITSEDVAFSIMTLKEHHPFKPMYATVERVETPDPHTAVIRMSTPSPHILLAMSPALCPILPKHVYGKGNIRTNPANNNNVVGSGPFVLVEHRPGEHIIFKRFDKFFIEGRPYLDRIIIKVSPDMSGAVLALERGQLDALMFMRGTRYLQRLSQNPKLVITDKGFEGLGALNWIEFNLAREPFDDLRVRQAVAYAVDKDFILKVLLSGSTSRATGPIHPGSPFYTSDVNKYPVDLDKAAALLDEAGYKPRPDGTRLDVTMDYIPGDPENSKNVAEYFKSQLRKIGINVTLRASPDFATWANRMAAHDFQMTTDNVWNWGDPNIGVARTYLTSNIKNVVWTNVMSYRNPKVDELLAQAAIEVDPEKRRSLYVQFQKLVVQDLPVLYLNVTAFRTVYNQNVANIPTNIWGLMSPMDTVYWKAN